MPMLRIIGIKSIETPGRVLHLRRIHSSKFLGSSNEEEQKQQPSLLLGGNKHMHITVNTQNAKRPFEGRAANTSWGGPAYADASVRDARDDQVLRGARNGILEADGEFSVRSGFVAVRTPIVPTNLPSAGG